ncbi:MAG: 2-dehydropantoate 2-reductase [Candidatus Eremiobacteraeota bacterium]|nr:2-dehydropantoate 2-reductase [Candidatus Eremiobacteraeota bacterium]
MKILVVGAGATGGYFGGRLLEAGRTVTFLVRPARAAQLAANGLFVQSPLGDVHVATPPTVLASALAEPYDLVIVSCKAYDLEAAAESFAPAVGPQTLVLPLLNGMQHIEMLGKRFERSQILGGMCLISSTLDADGRIVHLNQLHDLTFGQPDGVRSAPVAAVEAEFSHARFNAHLSDNIVSEMWAKWVLIASGAGATCLMRGTVGDIVAADAQQYALAIFDECSGVATAASYPVDETSAARIRALLTTPQSPLTASMFRDIERGARTEEDQIIGDLVRRGEHSGAPPTPLLRLVDAHLRTYEARRARETMAAG